MKTLKVGALALGMMFAGSVVAMETKDTLGRDVALLKEELKDSVASFTPEQKEEFADVDARINFYMLQDSVVQLRKLKAELVQLAHNVKYQQAGKVGKAKLATMDFIKTHPKKLGVLAAVAVVAAAYLVYRKFTAKKKIATRDEDETEDEVVEVVVLK